MCVSDERSTNPPPASDALMALQRVCLDFQLRSDRFSGHFGRFLERHRQRLELGDAEDPAAAYLERVWPNHLPATLILANIAVDSFGRWLLRPPVDGPLAGSFAAGMLAPAFRAYRRQGRLVIDGFEIAPHVRPRPFEVLVSAQIHINSVAEWMSPEDFARLDELPRHRAQTEQRLVGWREYLDWKQQLIRGHRVALRYEHLQRDPDGTLTMVTSGPHDLRAVRRRMGQGSLLLAPLSASQSPQLWSPHPDHRPRFRKLDGLVRIGPRLPSASADTGRQGSASPHVTPPDNGRCALAITLRPDEATRERLAEEIDSLPQEGFLLSPIGGEMKPLQAERKAIERLRNDQGYNPYLADCIFDIGNAAQPDALPEIPQQPSVRLNAEQWEALRQALAAPDMFLLQGPPGTGKTTVIAEICRQLIRQGLRVLVVSQANLAVDNVLFQLAQRPEVRPLRVAKADRVEPEFQGLLEEYVVAGWLQAVRQDCSARLHEREATEHRISAATESFSKLRSVLGQAEETRGQSAPLERQVAELRRQRDEHLSAQQAAEQQAGLRERRGRALRELAEWAAQRGSLPTSGDLIAETPAADILAAAIEDLRRVVPDSRWALAWLTSARTSPSAAIVTIELARQAALAGQSIEPHLVEALALCRGAITTDESDQARQLGQLLAEKARLMDSDREEDAQRLVRINREINRAREGRWARLCRSIQQALTATFHGPLPEDLRELASSLKPAAHWVHLLEELLRFAGNLGRGFRESLERSAAVLGEQVAASAESLDGEVGRHRTAAARAKDQLAEIDHQIEQGSDQLEDARARLHDGQQRWGALWPSACPDLEAAGEPPAMTEEALRPRQAAFGAWVEQQTTQRERHRRWRPILEEWIHRLLDPAAAPREALQTLYVKHANVVGLTCNETGQRHFYDRPDFEPFDVVIVDEVSKATPPELLLALLLARKVILVGDHRQLPPMFREDETSYAEAVAEGQIDPEDFRRFKRLVTSSYFGELFEAAPDALRQTLLTQYRMHPQIMAVVNQFYDGRLSAGGGDADLDARRQHHLRIRDLRGGWLLEEHQHVLWIDSTRTPAGRLAAEQQRGTSKVNPLEVDLIIAMLLQLNQALAHRGYGPCREAVAGHGENGQSTQRWIERLLPAAPPDTVADLFARRQVKVNGRIARPADQVHHGDHVDLDARKSVGVITFYGAQLGEIRRRLGELHRTRPQALAALDVRSNTVDRFQGMERGIVLISLVRARPDLRISEYVKQYQRINVAFSRAQELLVIVGSERTYRDALIELPSTPEEPPRQVPAYRNIFELVKQFGGRRYANQLLP